MHERDILLTALEKGVPEERAAYLAQMCGDDVQLKSRVEALLRSAEIQDSFLERSPVKDHRAELAAGSGAVPLTAADQDRTTIEPANLRLDFLSPSEKPGCLGLLGQYEILEVVGRGGMGIVLKGHDTKLNRIVAIKVLSPEISTIPTAHKRFLREAQAAAAVSHDHIVTIYAVEEHPVPHLVMEYIDGVSLQEKIDAEGQLELKEVLRIGRQIAAGLAAAHEQGLTHRDIKPSNILLRNGIQRVQITDFGLARATADVDITRTGEVTGTPQYMSPEQARSRPIDHRSDLFSLGAVLYAMCAGRSPFRADTPLAAIKRVCDDEPRPLRENNPEIPEWMEAIIGKLLAKAPDDRFQSAEEVADLLSRHLAHLQDPGATQFPGTLPVAPPSKRRQVPRHWLTAAAVLLIGLAGLGFAEATGVTNLASTVIRIATGEGTLVIEVDDPTVQVSLDGEELTITGAGIQELTLRPGQYQFQAIKDGEPVKQELVSITRGGRQVVRAMRESVESARATDLPIKQPAAGYTCIPEGAITLVRRLECEFDLNYWPADLEFSSNGTQLVCGRCAQVAEVWDLQSGQRLCVKPIGGRLAVSRHEDDVAAVNPDEGVVRLLRLNDLGKIRTVVPRDADLAVKTRCISLSSDNRHIVTGSDDGAVRVWDAETGQETHRFDYDRRIYSAEFSSDARRVLVLDGGYTLRLIDVELGEEIWQTELSGFSFTSAFSPCGRWVIAAPHCQLCLLDATTGEEVRRFKGHTEMIQSVRFLPDSRHVLSGSYDRTMRLWNVRTGQEVARLTAENHFTNTVAVSPDGRHAASGGGDFYALNGEFGGDGDYDLRLWQLPESVWPKDVGNVSQKPANVASLEAEGTDEKGESLLPEESPAANREDDERPAENSSEEQPAISDS